MTWPYIWEINKFIIMSNLLSIVFLALMFSCNTIKTNSKIMQAGIAGVTSCDKKSEDYRNSFPSSELYKRLSNNGCYFIRILPTQKHCNTYYDYLTIAINYHDGRPLDSRNIKYHWLDQIYSEWNSLKKIFLFVLS